MNTYNENKIKDSFRLSIHEVIAELDVDSKLGLSSKEANIRFTNYGPNRLMEVKKKSLLRVFFSQLNDALIYVLFVAVSITFVMGEYTDGIIILMVILINAFLGLFQEVRATNAIDALRSLSQPNAIVLRDGKTQELDAETLVPGDIIFLDAGRYVPADLRLIESANLKIDESALTGESVATQKDATAILEDDSLPVGDRINLAFMSTLVTFGRATAVVIGTGDKTEVGKIAGFLGEEKQDKTPLEIRLSHLGKTLGKIAVTICLIIFVISYFQGRDLTEMFLTSVSLAVASIPEGLAAIVAIVLSIGVTKMAKKNAIIKKLPAVETLGSVNIICSDKTGTLTQNKMTVQELFTFTDNLSIVDGSKNCSDEQKFLAEAMTLASDATLEANKQTGDPTEVALLVLADSLQIDRALLQKEQPRLDELAFDSDRKLMSTLNQSSDNFVVYTKGAVDNLILKCESVLENSEIIPLTDTHKTLLDETATQMANNALRTLAVAYKSSKTKISNEQFEENLIFIGMVGMIDPPRKEVRSSIETANEAGIITVMITGDHRNTALAIAKELGIADNDSQAITGKEISNMSVDKLQTVISDYRVFARVSPENKVNIVKAFKANGNIVSMTGDGVNDAPSLKIADIGVAMGITGTDVAKNAADMILADDNYATIITAIEQGKNIYNNIKKAVIFLLSSNLGEVIAMFVAIVSGLPVPLLATQLLWINLITDTLPAVALGLEPSNPGVMKEKPRPLKENFFSHGGISRIIIAGISIGFLTIVAFLYGYHKHSYNPFTDNIPEEIHRYARTMAFLTIISSQLLYSLSFKDEIKSIFSVNLFANKYLIAAIVFSFGLQVMVLNIPFLKNSFKLQSVELSDWLITISLGTVPLIVNEIFKIFRRLKKS